MRPKPHTPSHIITSLIVISHLAVRTLDAVLMASLVVTRERHLSGSQRPLFGDPETRSCTGRENNGRPLSVMKGELMSGSERYKVIKASAGVSGSYGDSCRIIQTRKRDLWWRFLRRKNVNKSPDE
ncbi:hypothetical protein TNCV_972221 [Trichonephila clavipes]|nr:hypothetical protein TNCV_972221 [Trichonephila clavipes]